MHQSHFTNFVQSHIMLPLKIIINHVSPKNMKTKIENQKHAISPYKMVWVYCKLYKLSFDQKKVNESMKTSRTINIAILVTTYCTFFWLRDCEWGIFWFSIQILFNKACNWDD